MILDKNGREIRVRGRQISATEKDIVDFLDLVLDRIPEAKLYNPERIRQGEFPRISPREWAALPEPCEIEREILFHENDWTPEFTMEDDAILSGYRLTNLPSPSVSMVGGGMERHVIVEIGRPVVTPRLGNISSNDFRDDPWGKKIVDKVYRLMGKIFSNKAYNVDLISRERGETFRYGEWHGRDAARRCREEKETYLSITHNFRENRFSGLKPDDD